MKTRIMCEGVDLRGIVRISWKHKEEDNAYSFGCICGVVHSISSDMLYLKSMTGQRYRVPTSYNDNLEIVNYSKDRDMLTFGTQLVYAGYLCSFDILEGSIGGLFWDRSEDQIRIRSGNLLLTLLVDDIKDIRVIGQEADNMQWAI